MNPEVLKSVIFDQHEIIRNAHIVPRRYSLDPQANYVITGLRRAGKSTLLYNIARDLVESGVEWNRIIYINFEDERLAEFHIGDFNDILSVQSELSRQSGFFFFDEIQNVAGWEKFARRLADAGERLWITGCNANMLSSQIATTLGGRYFVKHVTPYRFDEYLDAAGVPHDAEALYATKAKGAIAGAFETFLSEWRVSRVAPLQLSSRICGKRVPKGLAWRRGGTQWRAKPRCPSRAYEEGCRNCLQRNFRHGTAWDAARIGLQRQQGHAARLPCHDSRGLPVV